MSGTVQGLGVSNGSLSFAIHCLLGKVLVAQSSLTLCDPMDCAAHQPSLSMEFSRQEYWSGLPFPFPGIFPTQGLKTMSPTPAGRFFTEPPGKTVGKTDGKEQSSRVLRKNS